MSNGTPQPPSTSARSLWIGVVLAFLLLISAWSFLIVLANQNKPELIQPAESGQSESPPAG